MISKAQYRLSTWPIIQTGLPRLTLEIRKKGHRAVSSVCFVVLRLMLRPDPINLTSTARTCAILPHKISTKVERPQFGFGVLSGFVFADSSTRRNFFLANSQSVAPAVAISISSPTVGRQFKRF